jgi:hypothetical protein
MSVGWIQVLIIILAIMLSPVLCKIFDDFLEMLLSLLFYLAFRTVCGRSRLLFRANEITSTSPLSTMPEVAYRGKVLKVLKYPDPLVTPSAAVPSFT